MSSDTPDDDLQDTSKKRTFGVLVIGLSQALKFTITILSSVVLGRLLTPKDFGLVALVGPIVALADLVRDLGFTQAIVQREDISKAHVNALFWLSLGITLLIAAVLSAISPLVALFFNEPKVKLLLVVTAWTLVLGSMGALPNAWLTRQLKFGTIAIIESFATVMGFLSAALFAWFTHSYWALIISGIAYSVVSAGMALAFSGWLPGRPSFDRSVYDMTRFGAGISIANIGNFIARNADNFLIAKADGPGPLGLYDRAYKLMLMPLSQITWPLSRVLVPILCRQIKWPAEYCQTYLSSISYLMLVGQPALLFCGIYSTSVITLLLGDKWGGVAPIFSWLSLAAVQQLVTLSTSWLFISQGRAKNFATISTFCSAVAVVSFLIGLPRGPLGVAASFAIFDLFVRAPTTWWSATRHGPVTLKLMVATVYPHVIALFCSAAILFYCKRFETRLSLAEAAMGMALAYLIYIAVLCAWSEKRALLGKALQISLKQLLRFRASPQPDSAA